MVTGAAWLLLAPVSAGSCGKAVGGRKHRRIARPARSEVTEMITVSLFRRAALRALIASLLI
jgi:hypothetical protein